MGVTFDNFDKKKLRIGKTQECVYYGKRRFDGDIGNCRYVFQIEGVIVKFDPKEGEKKYADCPTRRQTRVECERYKKFAKGDLKYFPRCKSFRQVQREGTRLVEIQEYIEGSDYYSLNDKAMKIENRLRTTYGLCDIRGGNAVLVDGMPMIFDFGC